jgi:mono/diheme cytochrome c family protein
MRTCWLLSGALFLVLAGCDSGGGGGTTTDTGNDSAGGDTSGDTGVDPVTRGEYLVSHVLACGDCHTPRDQTGAPMAGMLLAGNPTFTDLSPETEGVGLVPAPNLTPDSTGLGDWTDDEIRTAITQGTYPAKGRHSDTGALFPAMPYWVFHLLTDDDLNAIVAYLRSIPAVNNAISEREPLGFPLNQPAAPVPADAYPETSLADDDPNYLAAERGAYLTQFVCADCHTRDTPQAPVPIDTTRIFAGGRIFAAADLGLPVPPFPAEIYSRNLTPDTNGLHGWTAQQIADALRMGVDDEGTGLCPPMPAGPMGAFGGMTEEDALAIGTYLTTIPAVSSDDYPECTPPAQ